VYLDAHGARRVISRSHLVQPQHFSRRVVEFIMVDFDMGKRCIELDVNVALPRRKLECRHGWWKCKWGIVVLIWWWWWKYMGGLEGIDISTARSRDTHQSHRQCPSVRHVKVVRYA
jgi:hypothetical protein